MNCSQKVLTLPVSLPVHTSNHRVHLTSRRIRWLPRSEVFICPWQRSTENGYAGGGNKFDLTKWNDAYFTRLKEFMSSAEKRNIVVELAFFCPFYEDIQWKISPMNASNNINGVGNVTER